MVVQRTGSKILEDTVVAVDFTAQEKEPLFKSLDKPVSDSAQFAPPATSQSHNNEFSGGQEEFELNSLEDDRPAEEDRVVNDSFSGFEEDMGGDNDGPKTATQNKAVADFEQAKSRMIAVIEDFLDYARRGDVFEHANQKEVMNHLHSKRSDINEVITHFCVCFCKI